MSDYFSPEQKAVLMRTMLAPFSEDQAVTFLELCSRVRLDPFAHEIYPLPRYDKRGNISLVPVVGIGGLRSIAHRSGEHAGTGPALFTPDDQTAEQGVWFEVWTRKGHPFAAKVSVWKVGSSVPTTAVARWDSFAVIGKDGELAGMWATKGDVMLGKVAEALALRKAFSNTAGLYVAEELGLDDSEVGRDHDNSGNRAPASAAPQRRQGLRGHRAYPARNGTSHANGQPAPTPDSATDTPQAAPTLETPVADGTKEGEKLDARQRGLKEIKEILTADEIPGAIQLFRSRGFLKEGQTLDDLSEEAIRYALGRRKSFLASVVRETDLLRAASTTK